MQPESGRTVYAGSDFQHRFHFLLCYAKRTRIRSEWPGQGLAKFVWSESKLVCRDHLARFLARDHLARFLARDHLARFLARDHLARFLARDHLARFLAGRNRAATSFPLLDSVLVFHRRPEYYYTNRPGSDLILADCTRFWPNGSGPEESQCARIIRPASGQCFPADPDRM